MERVGLSVLSLLSRVVHALPQAKTSSTHQKTQAFAAMQGLAVQVATVLGTGLNPMVLSLAGITLIAALIPPVCHTASNHVLIMCQGLTSTSHVHLLSIHLPVVQALAVNLVMEKITIKNSWNEQWGDQGFFLIRRGNNECGIEQSVSAGLVSGQPAPPSPPTPPPPPPSPPSGFCGAHSAQGECEADSQGGEACKWCVGSNFCMQKSFYDVACHDGMVV